MTKYIDLDTPNKEVVLVLQPDRTWKRYDGVRVDVNVVRFEGTPEKIAEEIQQLRDSVEWDDVHYCKIPYFNVATRYNNIVLWIVIYLTNKIRGYDTLNQLKRVVLEGIINTLLQMRNDAQVIIIKSLALREAQEIRSNEDEVFLQQLETVIEVHKFAMQNKSDKSNIGK